MAALRLAGAPTHVAAPTLTISNKALLTGSLISPAKKNADEIIYTLEEVSWHDHAKDCWVVIFDRVYDITNFIEEHPGGFDVLLENAGHDSTGAFRGVGHSKTALFSMSKYQIGILPTHERLYRKSNGYKVHDMPE